MSKIVVRCGAEWLKADNLKILRTFTDLGYAVISNKIKQSQPIAELILFCNDYDEVENRLNRFIAEAGEKRLSYEIFELSEEENFSEMGESESYKISPATLRNIFEGSRETRRQLEREDELKFGGDE